MSGTKLSLFFVRAKFSREKIVRKQIEDFCSSPNTVCSRPSCLPKIPLR